MTIKNIINFLLSMTLVFSPFTFATDVECTDAYDLQSCMDEVSDSGGGTITLSGKSYYLTDSLVLKDDVNIVGQGFSSVITWDSSISETIDAPLLFAESVNNISLENLKLRCNIDQSASSEDFRNDHMGLFLDGEGSPELGEDADNNNINLETIEVAYCSHGIHIKGAEGITANNLKLHDNGNTETDLFHNIYFRRVADVTMTQDDSTASNVGFYDSPRGHGIRMSHMKDIYYENLHVFSNADHGIHMSDGIENARFSGLVVEGNCDNSSGSCSDIKCYGTETECDIDYDANKE